MERGQRAAKLVLGGEDEVVTDPFFFFFSSRRRHTRCGRDWSSDVCSSDLGQQTHQRSRENSYENLDRSVRCEQYCDGTIHSEGKPGIAQRRLGCNEPARISRSEERRVGKEWRCRWAAYQEKEERLVGVEVC